MKTKWIYFFAIVGFVIVIDQLVKIYVHTNFVLGESIVVIPHFFNLTYVRNFGAAFGVFAESHPTFREFFFLSVPPAALLFIVYLLRTVPDSDKWQIWALSAVAGGAIGNYIDRLLYRYVIDFLDFHYDSKWSYPAFNIADMAIVTGVGILILLMAKESFAQKKQDQSQAANAKSST
ncbi:MAG: signal peptidase II [Pseudobdellovibrionaceae bacterium]